MKCAHTRGVTRVSAITVCSHCRDFVCSICGDTLEWYEGLRVTNPPAQWRYCAKAECVAVEAAYHAMSVEAMTRRRDELHSKRMLEDLRSREPRSREDVEARVIAAGGTWEGGRGRPERITLGPSTFKLDPGEACWCNLGKDCTGNHEIYIDDPVHRCGLCGQTFEIKPDDPHWSTGRGPICPKETR